MTRFVTAESVRRGHPDKLCDQIADRILDEHLRQDPNARVAVEVFATAGKLLVAGEVTSRADVGYEGIVWETIRDIGYRQADLCVERDQRLQVEVRIHEQSPDIARAVGENDDMGAGDQGIVVGYATDETPEYLPLPVVLAHGLCRALDDLGGQIVWLGADGKTQVTVAYENGRPSAVTDIIVSAQHVRHADCLCMRLVLMDKVIGRVVPTHLLKPNTRILINPSGQFVIGGPVGDTGLTGRKLAVDQYGPIAHIGGGALSGKDPTKVDRSGAYAARWVAKNIVAAGLVKRCEVQIAYAIGRSKPVSVTVNAFGTSAISDRVLSVAVKEAFDLRPAAIIQQLGLRAPIYTSLAAYGHFGRTDLDLPWERTEKKTALIRSLMRMGCEM